MSQIYRNNETLREIEAMVYLIDEVNQSKVMKWLDSRLPNATVSHAGEHGELITVRPPNTRKTLYVQPGDIVGMYTNSNEVYHVQQSIFLKHFTKLTDIPETGVRYSTRMTNPRGLRKVIPIYYQPDGSNRDEVEDFLRTHGHPRALRGHMGRSIFSAKRDGDQFNIPAGSVAVVYLDNGDVSYIGVNLFHSYFEKDEEPAPTPKESVPTPYTYVRKSDPDSRVEAIQWLKGVNDREFCRFIISRGLGSCSPNSTGYDGNLYFYPDYTQTDVFNKTDKINPLAIPPEMWFVLRDGRYGSNLPLVMLYADSTFQSTFTKKEPAMTESTTHQTVLTYDTESEYGQHRTEVLDALAILRSNPTNAHFDLAASEIMALLSSAYNEGFDYGMETAQTNPYEDWSA